MRDGLRLGLGRGARAALRDPAGPGAPARASHERAAYLRALRTLDSEDDV